MSQYTMVPIDFEFLLSTGVIRWHNQIIAQPGGAPAVELDTTGAPVNVGNAAPPTAGKVLTATSATTATWQTPAGGGGGWQDDGLIIRPVTLSDRVLVGAATSGLVQGQFYSLKGSNDFAGAFDGAVQIVDSSGGDRAYLDLKHGLSVPVGASGKTRFRYHQTDRVAEYSQNGEPFYRVAAGSVLYWGASALTVPAGTNYLRPYGSTAAAFSGGAPSAGDSRVGLVMPGRGRLRSMVVDLTTAGGGAEAISFELWHFSGGPSAMVTAIPAVANVPGPLTSSPLDYEFDAGNFFQVSATHAAPYTAPAPTNIHVTVYAEFYLPS